MSSATVRSITMRAGAAIAIAALAACSTETPTTPSARSIPLRLDATVDPGGINSNGGTLDLCKWSSSSTPVTFTITKTAGVGTLALEGEQAITPTDPNPDWPQYPFQSCIRVLNNQTISGTTTISITEEVPAGTQLDVRTSDGIVSSISTATTNNITVEIGNRQQARVFFKNSGTPTETGDGCTYTQGYWKTHSASGPAKKADPTWLILSNDQNTIFFTGSAPGFFGGSKTWLQVFNTPPKGNADISLADQFMAAYLSTHNVDPLKTATIADATVQDAYDNALAYFSGTLGFTPTKAQVQGWAATLDAYNNGKLGTPHCGQEATS